MKILQIKSYYEFKNNPSSSKNKELTWTIRHLSETTTIIWKYNITKYNENNLYYNIVL